MKIIGHGIDMVSIQAIKDQRDRSNSEWENGFFSDEERAQADRPPVDARYFASRFAGKEAVAKALGTGFAGDITWRGIEILRDASGAPFVRLRDEVSRHAKSLGVTEWKISISYCGEFAMVSVVAIGE